MTLTVLVTDSAWPSLDVERAAFAKIGAELIVATEGSEDELVSLAGLADAILTCWAPVTARVLDAATRCRTVARYGVGLDNIDVEHASELGIVVTNVPDYCVDEVSDHALALILTLARHIVAFAGQTAAGGWDNTQFGPMRRVRTQTLGLIGYGNIARRLGDKAAALGMRVLTHSRSGATSVAAESDSVTFAPTLEALLAESDFVSVHVPLTDQTSGLIGSAELAAMKPTGYLINTSRGAVVDTDALAHALRGRVIAGAALDVLPVEPPAPDDALRELDNLILTPHAAFDSVESIEELQRKAARNVVDVLSGNRPKYLINADAYGTEPFALRATQMAVSR
jgi:D-3-phosphoglycerate dehydrogenase / 2-oxoglutarate reductase